MRFFAEQAMLARYLEGQLLHYGMSPLRASDGEERQETRRWLEALVAMRKHPEGYRGDLGLILALQLLPTMQFPEEDTPLAELASNVVVLWAEALIDAARTRTYENPRFEYLHRCVRDVRVLDARLLRAGIDVLVSVLLDPGEHEVGRSNVARTLGELGRHAPVPAFFTCLRHCPTLLSMAIERALQAVGDQTPLEPLLAALLDTGEHWKVREQAAYMLGRRGTPEGVHALVEVTREDDSLACHAIDALVLLGENVGDPV